MSWTVKLKRSANRELESLPTSVLARVDKVLLSLEEDPFPRSAIKLKGREAYRIRIGSYRVLYVVLPDENIIEVTAIKHRKEAYRKRRS